ncbi:MAG: hypothetical protein J6A89_04125 [Clostridia bacterium]|nr:hypothetical protein [Clostridia bacterium]
MENAQIETIIKEIRNEQHPQENDETIKGYIKDAEYNINYSAGTKIDYDKDLDARKLLKNHVLYDRYKRLAEFKCLYEGEYSDLQAKYYKSADV